ncbi:MAG TPA: hypothetical protein VET24_05225 [Actinomycetota bacterium]|nr:hypothetical protein [Actinomycetota bacterium]
MSESEDRGSALGLFIKIAIMVGVLLVVLSIIIRIVHWLLIIAALWFLGVVGLALYRSGRRRGR